ncbi:hypothetical protein WR25_25953 isoform A [Diploscapter pachys]|uniref:Armadillo repeat-containing domain-containing protein n=1 Tax=Diploscapter pachys TaxID=2018661 RepID=A0A2A2KSP3_9BILA|nr:hypothetical protein WR25_25953 isoform A [Diploscapter pachys]
MGQQSSAFVVEIANPRLGRFQLLTALHIVDSSSELLLPLLTVISNCTARVGNQVLFRENSIVKRVYQLFPSSAHWPRPCRIMLLQCLANMCGDFNNLPTLQGSTALLVKKVSSSDETEATIAMQALTNLSRNIQPSQVNDYVPAIGPCLDRLWIRGETNLNALRLLVNLACCPQIVPMILGSKVGKCSSRLRLNDCIFESVMGLFRLLDCDKDEVLLRVLTWLLCLSSAVHALSITYDVIAPHNMDPFHNPSHTLFYSIYGPQGRTEMESRVEELRNSSNLEISTKSERLLETLKKIPRWPSTTLNQL